MLILLRDPLELASCSELELPASSKHIRPIHAGNQWTHSPKAENNHKENINITYAFMPGYTRFPQIVLNTCETNREAGLKQYIFSATIWTTWAFATIWFVIILCSYKRTMLLPVCTDRDLVSAAHPHDSFHSGSGLHQHLFADCTLDHSVVSIYDPWRACPILQFPSEYKRWQVETYFDIKVNFLLHSGIMKY